MTFFYWWSMIHFKIIISSKNALNLSCPKKILQKHRSKLENIRNLLYQILIAKVDINWIKYWSNRKYWKKKKLLILKNTLAPFGKGSPENSLDKDQFSCKTCLHQFDVNCCNHCKSQMCSHKLQLSAESKENLHWKVFRITEKFACENYDAKLF